MGPDVVLSAYDAQVRRRVRDHDPSVVVEEEAGIVRVVEAEAGWAGVVWSDLDRLDADAAIAAQIARFADRPGPWEWRHYSYDEPSDLAVRLVAAGFEPAPTEALLVAEITRLELDVTPPDGVRVVPVSDPDGVAALVRVHDVVFGGDHSGSGAGVAAGLARQPATVAAAVAMGEGEPVAAGRVEFHHGTEFASLWGGGTVEPWRHRGIFRALVAHRGGLAAARGFRYLAVDASADSRPILERLGFVHLADTTPFEHPGGAASLPPAR